MPSKDKKPSLEQLFKQQELINNNNQLNNKPKHTFESNQKKIDAWNLDKFDKDGKPKIHTFESNQKKIDAWNLDKFDKDGKPKIHTFESNQKKIDAWNLDKFEEEQECDVLTRKLEEGNRELEKTLIWMKKLLHVD